MMTRSNQRRSYDYSPVIDVPEVIPYSDDLDHDDPDLFPKQPPPDWPGWEEERQRKGDGDDDMSAASAPGSGSASPVLSHIPGKASYASSTSLRRAHSPGRSTPDSSRSAPLSCTTSFTSAGLKRAGSRRPSRSWPSLRHRASSVATNSSEFVNAGTESYRTTSVDGEQYKQFNEPQMAAIHHKLDEIYSEIESLDSQLARARENYASDQARTRQVVTFLPPGDQHSAEREGFCKEPRLLSRVIPRDEATRDDFSARREHLQALAVTVASRLDQLDQGSREDDENIARNQRSPFSAVDDLRRDSTLEPSSRRSSRDQGSPRLASRSKPSSITRTSKNILMTWAKKGLNLASRVKNPTRRTSLKKPSDEWPSPPPGSATLYPYYYA